jgi:hypothetical protein
MKPILVTATSAVQKQKWFAGAVYLIEDFYPVDLRVFSFHGEDYVWGCAKKQSRKWA